MVPKCRQVEGVRGLESRSLLDRVKFFTLRVYVFSAEKEKARVLVKADEAEVWQCLCFQCESSLPEVLELAQQKTKESWLCVWGWRSLLTMRNCSFLLSRLNDYKLWDQAPYCLALTRGDTEGGWIKWVVDIMGCIPEGHGPRLAASSLPMAYLPWQRLKTQVHLAFEMCACHPVLVQTDLRKAVLEAGAGTRKGFLCVRRTSVVMFV